ncbi:MAG: hypothetical protein M1335_04250 [Chloroflexi bacterium]|nr:hypothetical protein [Chloroflexota bacterium]
MPDARTRRLLGEEAQSKFKTFELLVVSAGSVAIIGSAVASYEATNSLLELTGQLLMLPVLLIALQFGRVGGLVSAFFAALLYAVAKYPGLSDAVLLGTTLQLLGVRALSYLIVGLVGGEAMTAVKYYFARSGGLGGVDPGSGLYVADFISGMVEKALFMYERYGVPFSVVSIEVDPMALQASSRFKTNKGWKALGNLLKGSLRIVDEVGRLDEFSFAILLPHTPQAGANIVAERTRKSIIDLYKLSDVGAVTARVYSVPQHLEELRDLVGVSEPQIPSAIVPVVGNPKKI